MTFCFISFLFIYCLLDDCRQLEFNPADTFDGKRLKQHVIGIKSIMDPNFCKNLCYMDPNCVSYNLKKTASIDGKYRCELNNATFEGQQDNLEANSKYLYRGAKVIMLQDENVRASVYIPFIPLCSI